MCPHLVLGWARADAAVSAHVYGAVQHAQRRRVHGARLGLHVRALNTCGHAGLAECCLVLERPQVKARVTRDSTQTRRKQNRRFISRCHFDRSTSSLRNFAAAANARSDAGQSQGDTALDGVGLGG